jgi:hypothetical protein
MEVTVPSVPSLNISFEKEGAPSESNRGKNEAKLQLRIHFRIFTLIMFVSHWVFVGVLGDHHGRITAARHPHLLSRLHVFGDKNVQAHAPNH